MFAQTIWWIGILLEAIIVIRGWRAGHLRKYPIFYAYLACVLVQDLLRFAAFRWYPRAYPHVYWDSELLSVFLGCGVIFEVYRVGLKSFPGTARMARNLLFFVFAMVIAKALVLASDTGGWWASVTAMKLERDLRIMQAAALLALVVVSLAYAIPLGRNLKGMLMGFGVFLGTSVLQLAVMVHFGRIFSGPWPAIRSASYLAVLLLWMVALWTYQEAPKAARAITLDEDYQMLVANTRKRFARSRMALGKVVRP